jgi:hypothetical protein
VTDFITVAPAPHHLTSLAQWAVAQFPKVATNGHASFAVPPRLFADIPAALLTGATVDGQPWVAPVPSLPDITDPVPAPEQPDPAPKTSTRRKASKEVAA